MVPSKRVKRARKVREKLKNQEVMNLHPVRIKSQVQDRMVPSKKPKMAQVIKVNHKVLGVE